ncbi:hypothetical protein ACWTU6_18660 [Mesorhizobium sp. BHbsci]
MTGAQIQTAGASRLTLASKNRKAVEFSALKAMTKPLMTKNTCTPPSGAEHLQFRMRRDAAGGPCRNAGGKGPHPVTIVVEHHEDCGEKSKYVDAAKCGFLLSHA